MRRTLIAAFAALILGIGLVWTQPTEAWLAQAPAAAASYTGPGDVISLSVDWSLRAYTSATRGNKLVNVCNSTGGVDIGCADMLSDATTGQLVSATIAAITCPGANCTIKTFYDLTGGTFCSGAACDATQATVAQRATLDASVIGSLPGAHFVATTTGACYSSPGTAATSQPFSYTYVGERTGSGTTARNIVIDNGNLTQISYTASANQVQMYFTTSQFTATASDANPHAIQFAFDGNVGSGSTIYVDGSATTGTSNTSGTITQPFNIGAVNPSNCSNQPMNGYIFELGFKNALFSGTDLSGLNTNQHGTNGWNF